MRNSLITILILSFLIIPVFSDDVPSSKGGFITIPPVQFYFHKGSYKGRLELISSPAKIWYCIQRADNDWRNKPLFVFFNGGPGSATSYGLMSLNTGKRTFDTLSEPLPVEFSENANSWSRMGNLLYIDARQTGFSYCTLENGVEQQDERLREFNAQNFNSYFDAADFIRVLLAIFEKYPDIKGNRVILVGESYGGNRATMMLYMLLNFKLLSSPTNYLNFEYQDPDLGRQLLAHFSSLYPDIRRSDPAEWVKQQFSHQVLIQPVIDGYNETLISGEMLVNEGSPVYELAEEVGIPFVPVHDGSSYFWQVLDYVSEIAKRDYYCYYKPVDWMNDIFMKAGFLLNNVDQLEFFLGHDLKLINDLYARNRGKAYRVVDPTSYTDFGAGIPVTEKFLLTRYLQYQQKLKSLNNGNLHTFYGPLKEWDRFFIGLNYNSNHAFWSNVAVHMGYYVSPYTASLGFKFLEVLKHVETFITNAKYDLIVYTNAIPRAFKEGYSHRIKDVIIDNSGNYDRPGNLIFKYHYSWGSAADKNEAIVRFPSYGKSGHAVTITEPREILEDVIEWLAETQITKGEKINEK